MQEAASHDAPGKAKVDGEIVADDKTKCRTALDDSPPSFLGNRCCWPLQARPGASPQGSSVDIHQHQATWVAVPHVSLPGWPIGVRAHRTNLHPPLKREVTPGAPKKEDANMAPTTCKTSSLLPTHPFIADVISAIRKAQPKNALWADIFEDLLAGVDGNTDTCAVLKGGSCSGHFTFRVDLDMHGIQLFVAILDEEGNRTDLGPGDGYVFLAEHGCVREWPEHYAIALDTVERVIAEGGVYLYPESRLSTAHTK